MAVRKMVGSHLAIVTRQRMSGAPQWGPVGDGWGDNRQIPAEVRERLREAQDLRREWGATSTGATRQLDEVIDRLKQLADGRMEGDAATAALLKQDVIEPLRQLELELSQADSTTEWANEPAATR